MGCCHPLKGFVIRPRSPTAPAEIKVCGYGVDHIFKRCPKDPWMPSESKRTLITEYKTIRDYVLIPCGKCIECRLQYSRNWADRCMLELQDHKSSYFLTLTYDDQHVHTNRYLDADTGEFGFRQTLCKSDLQKFWKRLRKNCGQKIRYFACGEYGGKTLRPHYHAIVYGLELDDLVFYKRSSQGFNYYTSEFLSNTWSNGYVVVTDVSWDTCAYTARYVLKKQKGAAADVYERYNYEPEFVVMSRKPGIARNYFDEHKDDIYAFDHISIPTPSGGHKIRPCRYYDKLYDIDEPDKMFAIKEQRKQIGDDMQKLKLSQTDMSYQEMLLAAEGSKTAKIKSLRRDQI